MSKLLNQECFKKLLKIVDKDSLQSSRYIKLVSPGMMDLNIDKLSENRYSIAHNYVQNGDVMADPDCEVIVDWDKEEITCLTYQQDGLGIYRCADNNVALQNSLTSFLSTWLDNIIQQEYTIKIVKVIPN